MFQLKSLAADRISAALEKAERYRLLNEPVDAESICRDVLRARPDNQDALVTLLLALTDRFPEERDVHFKEACEIASRLRGEYEQSYYLGIIHERRAKAQHATGRSCSGPVVYAWFEKAMRYYELARERCRSDNDEALLRWNTCARFIMEHPDVRPSEDVRAPLELE
jgi:hypothetical protein